MRGLGDAGKRGSVDSGTWDVGIVEDVINKQHLIFVKYNISMLSRKVSHLFFSS